MKKSHGLLLAVILIIFNSCIGLSIDIQMNRDGSGKLLLEYRISRTIETLGALDGNTSMPTIPIGREDWERSMERVRGARMTSFSSSKSGQDTINKITVDFDNPKALLQVLDSPGESTSIDMNNRIFKIILKNDFLKSLNTEFDERLLDLARMLFSDYKLAISFSAPSNSSLTVTDVDGKEINPPARADVVSTGRRVSISVGIIDLLDIPNGLGLRFNW